MNAQKERFQFSQVKIFFIFIILAACANDGAQRIESIEGYEPCIKNATSASTNMPGRITLLFMNETQAQLDAFVESLGPKVTLKRDYPEHNLTYDTYTLNVPEGEEEYWLCIIKSKRPENLLSAHQEIPIVLA